MEVSIGCDPEFFLRDLETGEFVSAHGLVPGTKKDPFIVNKGAYQVDGMALEFNTNPVTTAFELKENIWSVLGDLREAVPDSLEFDFSSWAMFSDKVLDNTPEKAKELGCDPDYNAYTGLPNPKPVPPLKGLRTASGHVHIGLGDFPEWRTSGHFVQMSRFVKGLDRFLGTATVIIDPDNTRRQLYGCAGAFRVKPYGCEYRVPSNAWVNSMKTDMVVDSVLATVEWMMDGGRNDITDDEVVNAINSGDVNACRDIYSFVSGKDFTYA